LFDGVVIVAGACCCVMCWLREGQCLMLVAAGVVGLLFTGQLKEGICRFWSFLWLGARTCMLKTSECC
jgi:hypothetical protein